MQVQVPSEKRVWSLSGERNHLPKFSSSQAGTPDQDGHTERQQGDGLQVSNQVEINSLKLLT